VSAVGITVALLVFSTVVPALKAELDEFPREPWLRSEKRAFGTGGGRFSQVLSVGSTAARRIPIVIILIAALVSAGGAYGATQVDTSFNQEDSSRRTRLNGRRTSPSRSSPATTR